MALTTVASVKAFMGLTGTSADAVLAELITQLSAQVDNFCQRTLGRADHSHWIDGSGGTRLLLTEWPVVAVSLVQVNGVSIPAAADPVSQGYRFFDAGELLLNPGGQRFTRGQRNVRVDFTAGYTDNQVPADLALACNRMVANMYRARDWTGYVSKSLAGETVTFRDEMEKDSVRSVLWNYRRVTP